MTSAFRPILVLLAVLAPAALSAADGSPLTSWVKGNVGWAEAPEIVAAIKAQNAAHAGLTQRQIDDLDQAWRAEVGTAAAPTITPVVTNGLSDFLRRQTTASGGVITEVFVMDDKGLLVGTSGVTSDYWQGDEDKWRMTYRKGPGAVHESAVEFDDSSQTYQGQVSITITDPATGEAIGAMTIGLDSTLVM